MVEEGATAGVPELASLEYVEVGVNIVVNPFQLIEEAGLKYVELVKTAVFVGIARPEDTTADVDTAAS